MRKIFVYGTLKKGFWNEHFLKDAQFICQDITRDAKFYMKEIRSSCKDGYTYPAVYENGSYKVSGEVYNISDKILKQLDILEDVNIEYIRKKVDLEKSGMIETYISIQNLPDLKNQLHIEAKNGILRFTNQNLTE